MRSAFRRALPDLALIPGIVLTLLGAYLLGGIAVLCLVLGLGLIGLAVWMT